MVIHRNVVLLRGWAKNVGVRNVPLIDKPVGGLQIFWGAYAARCFGIAAFRRHIASKFVLKRKTRKARGSCRIGGLNVVANI